VPERDRAAVHVELLVGYPELAYRGEHLRGERLVQLHQVEVVDGKARALERLACGRHGPDAHVRRVDAGGRARHDARQRLAAQLPGAPLGADHEARRTVGQLRRVAGPHGPTLSEDRPQLRQLPERGVRGRPPPTGTARDAWLTASRPEAHSRLTVTPGTSTGSPDRSAAIRATLRLSSPAPLVQPNTTSSTASGGRPLRSTTASITRAARS